MECNDKTKLTLEEEKSLYESIIKVLEENLRVVRRRFPNINDLSCPEEDPAHKTDDSDSLK